MKTFAGIGAGYAAFDTAEVLLQSIPYDGTSTWGKGADKGFDVFLDASEQMELYDIETDSEPYKKGIHLLPALEEHASPEAVYRQVLANTRKLLGTGKLLTFFGGEHSVSIGIMEAFHEKYPGLTILQLDAHADLRKEYENSPYNHACALHAANEHSNLVQVGIRSMDVSEKQYMHPDRCFFAHQMQGNDDWITRSLEKMGEQVYITIDLDVLDPSVMPATGTPEPGGMGYYELTGYLKRVFDEKEVVGFDLVEFAPVEGLHAPGFMVAKIYYKMLSYYFTYGKK